MRRRQLLAVAALAALVAAAPGSAAPARNASGPAEPAPSQMMRGGADAVTLEIAIGNVRVARGRVHVDICREHEFLKDCSVVAEAPAVAGTTKIVVRNLPPGDYAIQATLDENGNGRVDRGLFGIPREGVGFSNDAPIRLGPPKWRDARVHVAEDAQLAFKLRYF